jgi:hypothetical protein
MKILVSLALLCGLTLNLPPTATAGLTGSTVDVAAYYPSDSAVYDDPGSRIVSLGIEYPTYSYEHYNPYWQVDIADGSLTLTSSYPGPNPAYFVSAAFNGFILRVISGPALVSASIDPLSDFSPISISVQGGNEILMNFQGVQFNGPASATIDFATVPEPASFILLALAFAGLLISPHCRAKPQRLVCAIIRTAFRFSGQLGISRQSQPYNSVLSFTLKPGYGPFEPAFSENWVVAR